MKIVLKYFFFFFVIINNLSTGEWVKDHEICRYDHHQSKYLCHYPSYYVNAFKLSKSSSGYAKEVSQLILSLYRDLHERLRPVPMNIQNWILQIHPILFGISGNLISKTVPPKTKPFGKTIPGNLSTYFNHSVDEGSYLLDLRDSKFAITHKKAGWDCFRHYEILASGSLPLFVDIELSPYTTLVAHPKQLYSMLLRWPGLQFKIRKSLSKPKSEILVQGLTLDPRVAFDSELYMTVSLALSQFARNVFSTSAQAQYLIRTIEKNTERDLIRVGDTDDDWDGMNPLPPNPIHEDEDSPSNPSSSSSPSFVRRVLYLSYFDSDTETGDYQIDLLLHGLKEVLGPGVVDYPCRQALYRTPSLLNATSYYQQRSRLYGRGFNWAHSLEEPGATSPSLSKAQSTASNSVCPWDGLRSLLEAQVKARYFDLVVIAGIHRSGYASQPLVQTVCDHYPRERVAAVDGGDKPTPERLLRRFMHCAGHFFSREGPAIPTR